MSARLCGSLRALLVTVLASVLVASAGAKVADFDAYQERAHVVLSAFGVDFDTTHRLCVLVTVAEVVAGVAVLAVRRIGVLTLFVGTLIGVFVAWDGVRLGLGLDAACGCFGTIDLTPTWWHVVAKHGLMVSMYLAYCYHGCDSLRRT